MENEGWIGVDLDGTLAYWDRWVGPGEIGAPIPLMVERVKGWIAEGKDVRILTARVQTFCGGIYSENELVIHIAIQKWCVEHLGAPLPVTCSKDYNMIELWDDRAIGVERNTGRRIG